MNYISSALRQFNYYKSLGEGAMQQLSDEELYWKQNEASNSIAAIVKHMHGNMLSRWTDFMTTDGEKPNRNRDGEFEEDESNRAAIMQRWNEGWACLLDALTGITDNDLDKIIYIRNEGHTVLEAINRQLCHYPYHVGQIVFVGKMLKGDAWQSLSIPKGDSVAFNMNKFSQPKQVRHFTEGDKK